ncbi:MAG: hypothetical protein ABI559_07720, partial [Chloroflexota bacterium]
MQNRLLVLAVALALVLAASAGLLTVSGSSANAGGCPNDAATNGGAHANQHSAFYTHCNTPQPSPPPLTQTPVATNEPTPTPCTAAACQTPTEHQQRLPTRDESDLFEFADLQRRPLIEVRPGQFVS